ncbi:MAG: ATP-binding cassette domain-containing protein [Streptococcus sp.]|nr:ATP-binding cassette domain-containing protein [Streptococcus sp.]
MDKNIEIKQLTKTYKSGNILENVSFTAKEGEVTAFLGPNGAGKSSTLRILLGLDHATLGTALIGSKKYSDMISPLLTVGASFDGVGAPDDRTVNEHLRIAAVSNGISFSRIPEVLSITDIKHKSVSKIGNLSLGEEQRLGIATALLGNPQYLILDEPTNGLDPNGIRWFRNFIKKQAGQGKTILLSSHILSEVEAVTDKVVFINKGRIIAEDNLETIMEEYDNLENAFFNLAGDTYGKIL